MLSGEVGKVRELTRGVEADVCIGGTAEYGWAVVRVSSTSKRTMDALRELKASLRAEADDIIRAAQRDEYKRGRVPIGAAHEG